MYHFNAEWCLLLLNSTVHWQS